MITEGNGKDESVSTFQERQSVFDELCLKDDRRPVADIVIDEIITLRAELDRERQSRQSAQEQLERYKAEVTRLEHLLSAAKKDANRYRWLSSNSKHIKWIPSNYNKDVVSGFSAFSTGYLGFGFEEAIDAAIAAQEMK